MKSDPKYRGNSENGRCLTVRDIADYLKLSRKTVWRMVRRAQLKVHRVAGNQIRVTPWDFESFMQSTEVLVEGEDKETGGSR